MNQKNEYQQRVFSTAELVKQIGMVNVLAISGGRVHSVVNEHGETVELDRLKKPTSNIYRLITESVRSTQ